MKKAAYWIRKTHFFRSDEYICSRCGCSEDEPLAVCPDCGSLMKLSKYDPHWEDELEELEALLDD